MQMKLPPTIDYASRGRITETSGIVEYRYNLRMPSDQPVPRWLWNFANGVLIIVVLGIATLACALSRGLANPARAGTLWLFDDFKGDVSRWSFRTSGPAGLQPGDGALVARLTTSDQTVLGLTDGPGVEFSMEIAGTPMSGSTDLAYGLVFGWQDERHYSAVLVNGNGYAEAYQQKGDSRLEWFKWQQWPHAFSGDNRVRVEVSQGRVIARVNDEWLMEAALTTPPTGKIGLVARGAGAPGGIVFSWVKVWVEP
jgi:hypothetical protein